MSQILAEPESTEVAILTPPGRGAIATVLVRGRRARALVDTQFQLAGRQPLVELPIGRVAFGRFQLSALAPEELVVGIVAQNEIELHCHGGTAVVEAIVQSLVAAGAERTSWEIIARQTAVDRISGEAQIALAQARTERTAAILLDQLRGALAEESRRIDALLAQGEASAVAAALDRLLMRAEFGRHLTKPWRVVLLGAPNSGKSSLINSLLGYQRSIVHDVAGTTRDVLAASTAIDGWPVELIDTAGLRASGDQIEAEGIARAKQEATTADLALVLLDPLVPWAEQEAMLDTITVMRRLIIHNKCDLAAPPADGRPLGIEVSALVGTNLEALLRAVLQALVPEPPAGGAAVPFTERQARLLLQCRAALAAGDNAAARAALADL